MKTISVFSFLVLGMFFYQEAFAWVIEAQEVVSGRRIRFPESSGKIQVVTFLSAKCPCSAGHEPVLKELYREFSKDFKFIGVHSNQNEEKKLAQRHFAGADLPFPVIEDRDARIAHRLGAMKTPHVFVLKGTDVLYEGGIDDTSDGKNPEKRYLKDALTRIKEGKSPEISHGRVLGCAIKK